MLSYPPPIELSFSKAPILKTPSFHANSKLINPVGLARDFSHSSYVVSFIRAFSMQAPPVLLRPPHFFFEHVCPFSFLAPSHTLLKMVAPLPVALPSRMSPSFPHHSPSPRVCFFGPSLSTASLKPPRLSSILSAESYCPSPPPVHRLRALRCQLL